VIVWAAPDDAGRVALELRRRYPANDVLELQVAASGAGPA
jgi:hypothetical protein